MSKASLSNVSDVDDVVVVADVAPAVGDVDEADGDADKRSIVVQV